MSFKVQSLLGEVQDLERLIMKVATNYTNAKDLNVFEALTKSHP